MVSQLSFIILWIVLGALVFYRCSPKFWMPILAALLAVYSYFHLLNTEFLGLCWIVWAIFSLLIILSPLRRHFVIKPLLRWFKRQQPVLSAAEQQVLASGGVWWEHHFFSGAPDWRELLKLPASSLNSEEQSFLDNQVETLCRMINNWQVEHEDKNFSDEVWNYIKKEKFWGLAIEKKYGGHEFSANAHSAIIAKIASRSYSLAVTVMVPNALGAAEFLHHYGTPEQKEYFLPRLTCGEEIACFALTAPNAGSDAMSITDKGIVGRGVHEGREVIGIYLNWNKCYITLAPIATLIGVVFHLYDPDHLLGPEEDIGITVGIVPANHQGVEIGKRHCPLNMAFFNGPTRGHQVFIPMGWIIGGIECRGKGWQMMMECLALGRGISLPAVSTAVTQFCFRVAGAFATVRKQFNRPIGEFEGVKIALAHIGGFTYMSEATRLFTALGATEARPAVASAIAKYHLTEMSRQVVAHTMDIHAGQGIQLGPHNYLANYHNGVPISITVEGANLLTRNLIIFGQGVMRCHPYLRDEIMAADENNPHKLQRFDQLILQHIGKSLSEFMRTLVYGFTNGFWARGLQKSKLDKYLRQLTWMGFAFAFVTDVTLATVGGRLKFKEALSARLGDILSHLYLSSAVVKYFHDQGEQKQDLIFAEWSLHYSLHQIQTAFSGIFTNYPIRWVGSFLRLLIFPWGKKYQYPQDPLSFLIADKMQHDLILRDRLTKNCYNGDDLSDPVARLEKAFREVLAADPLYKKLEKAARDYGIPLHNNLQDDITLIHNKGALTLEEKDQLLSAEELRWAVQQVDEF